MIHRSPIFSVAPHSVVRLECGSAGEPNRERDRQTDRQTDRRTDGQTDEQTDRQTDREVRACARQIPITDQDGGGADSRLLTDRLEKLLAAGQQRLPSGTRTPTDRHTAAGTGRLYRVFSLSLPLPTPG
ncbi:putative glycosyltransferase [Liparis tanakae]|uniref:Putative glycosyltransferase n=1 Tax=Liparis tanakae TaxID=230148 RepID=A0A4Z2F811_9TELE|nr:putative glycosyltransferase [Liparis tanakae]